MIFDIDFIKDNEIKLWRNYVVFIILFVVLLVILEMMKLKFWLYVSEN